MKAPSLILLTFVTISQFASANSDACSDPATVISSVNVFDGESMLSNRDVVIECTKIVGIYGDAGEGYSTPEGAIRIDGTDRTLLPGLIDSHVHVYSRAALERALVFGVTTVFDMGAVAEGLVASLREEDSLDAANDRADILSSVLWATAPGSHGTQFGEVPTIANAEAADAFVEDRIDEGADFIKIIYDNFKMFDGEVPTLSLEALQAVIEAAHKRDRMAVIHSRDVEAMATATDAGADGFVHVAVDEVPDPELISALLNAEAFVSPNLSLARPEGHRLIEDPHIRTLLTEQEVANLENWRQMRREGGDLIEYEAVALLHAAGVPVLAGSDAPNGGTTMGASLHSELELLVEAGFAPMEALKSATSLPAELFGLEDRGRIAVGYRADLVLVEGSPDKSIADTRRIIHVWKAGKIQDG